MSNTLISTMVEWVQKNQEEIKTHVAWHPDVSESASENLLKNKGAFTYVLRKGNKEQSYFISFVKQDGTIKHQFFTLEYDQQGWIYRNGTTTGPTQIVSKELHKLIPMMMHCDLLACNPLMK